MDLLLFLAIRYIQDLLLIFVWLRAIIKSKMFVSLRRKQAQTKHNVTKGGAL